MKTGTDNSDIETTLVRTARGHKYNSSWMLNLSGIYPWDSHTSVQYVFFYRDKRRTKK
jgi:hypothetical protein